MDTTATTTKAPAKRESTSKTAMITLTANGVTMRIRARRKRDDTAKTFVTTTDAAKKTERGMTETHPTFEAAKASMAASAAKAEKLMDSASGRSRLRRQAGFVLHVACPAEEGCDCDEEGVVMNAAAIYARKSTDQNVADEAKPVTRGGPRP